MPLSGVADCTGCCGLSSSRLGVIGNVGLFDDGVRKKLATGSSLPCCVAGVSGAGASANDWQPESIWALMLASFTTLLQIGQSTIAVDDVMPLNSRGLTSIRDF